MEGFEEYLKKENKKWEWLGSSNVLPALIEMVGDLALRVKELEERYQVGKSGKKE